MRSSVLLFVAIVGPVLAQVPDPQVKAQPASSELQAGLRDVPIPPPAKKDVGPELRGDILMARKMYREAVDVYKEAPESAVTLNKIGIAYHQMLDFDDAKKYYERSLKLNNKYAEAINNLGTIAYAKKSYRHAIGQYKKALKYNPDSASIYSNLGTAYFARKNYDEAMKTYEKALSLDPEVFEHSSSAGVLLQERTVEERAKFHFYQAKLYAKNGMDDRALLCLRKALEEGLKEDRDKLRELPEFASIREKDEFKEILSLQPRAL
jgi:tetratricopeptide (TPR) repeat protein